MMLDALKPGIIVVVAVVMTGCIGFAQSEGPAGFVVADQATGDHESFSADTQSLFQLDEDTILLRETEPDLGVHRLDYRPMYSDVF